MGYDTLLLVDGCRRFGENFYPFLQSVSQIGKVTDCVKILGKKLVTRIMFGHSGSGMAMGCHNTRLNSAIQD
jgi:hypothetical protein